jgi:2-polyprenyl-3-methyl-5-hydroxy-6-metoxy-1,4-benzoquinol methylase
VNAIKEFVKLGRDICMTTTSILNKKRIEAAEASRGVSGEPIYRTVMAFLKGADSNCDLLEFGSGTGSLISQITSSGFKGSITAVDILSPPAVQPRQVKWMQADLNHPINVPDNSFDIIVSTEVIEHLENPRAIFREFHRLLRAGGKIVVTTPNQESIRSLVALLLGGHFVAFRDSCYPAHITALLRKDFERVCYETGFNSPHFTYTNVGGIPKLPHILWQQISFGLLTGRLFSDNVMLIATKSH